MTASEPEPALRRLLEAVAAVMDLDAGMSRLELIFEDGHLVKYYTHDGPTSPRELERYDGRAAWLGARSSASP
jgi:hypothetical protein